MSRQLRLEYPVAIYHVMNRGNQRNIIFRNDGDRELFFQPWMRRAAKPCKCRFCLLTPLPRF